MCNAHEQILLYNTHEVKLPEIADNKINMSPETVYGTLQNQTRIAFSAILQNLQNDSRFEPALLSKMRQLLCQKKISDSSFTCTSNNHMPKINFDMRHYFDQTVNTPTNIFQICSASNSDFLDDTSRMQIGDASLQVLSHVLHTQFPALLAEACTDTQKIKLLAISKKDANNQESAHFFVKDNSAVPLQYGHTTKKCFDVWKNDISYWKNRQQLIQIHKSMCKDVLLQNANNTTITHDPCFFIANNDQRSWSIFV